MTNFNSADITMQVKQPSDIEKCIDDCNIKFNQILSEVMNSNEKKEAHQMESVIFKRLLELGLLLLRLFFANYNQGNYGETVETGHGTAKKGKTSSKTYFSIFGKLKIVRYLYHTNDETFAPLDIFLNLPKRCYSYFLSEMINLFNIKDAYLEGVDFLKKFFGIQFYVSASETISDESSVCYEGYYEFKNTLPKQPEIKDYTVVSFDGKGVPMIKKDAVKIRGRNGKGEKRQKKKEALVGARYKINANVRTAEEIAMNLVYPEKKEEKKDKKKEEKAEDIRYIASIEKTKKQVMEEIHEEVRYDDFRKNPLLCLMDGSLYLWNLFEIVFKDIKNKVLILDIIHVLEYIWLTAHMMYKEGSDEAKQYVYENLLLILEGKTASYIIKLQAEMLSGRWNKNSQQKKFKKVITYFKNHRKYMNYDKYLEKGYPIGTGVIESACGHVVKNRMEISGARWGIYGAESILKLRSIAKSKDWDDYWKFFTSQSKNNEFFPVECNSLDVQEKMVA